MRRGGTYITGAGGQCRGRGRGSGCSGFEGLGAFLSPTVREKKSARGGEGDMRKSCHCLAKRSLARRSAPDILKRD